MMRKVIEIAVFLLISVAAVGAAAGAAAEATDGPCVLTQDFLESLYKDYVYAQLPWDKEDVTISRIRTRQKITLPGNTFTYEITPAVNGSFVGDTVLKVVFKIDGKEVRRERISGRVDLCRDVVCTSRPMARHEVIEEKDLCYIRRSISRSGAAAVYDMREVLGYRLLSSLRAGDMVKKDAVEPSPLVKKGDRITILAETEGLSITACGEAMEAGAKGKVIRVRNLGSKKEIYARVVDASTVQVEL